MCVYLSKTRGDNLGAVYFLITELNNALTLLFRVAITDNGTLNYSHWYSMSNHKALWSHTAAEGKSWVFFL